MPEIGNETKFINELKKSILIYEKQENNNPHALVWKIRGTAATSGRPDLLIISENCYFIEAKVRPIKDINKSKIDLLGLPTKQQLANLVAIARAGTKAYIAIKTSHDEGISVDIADMLDVNDNKIIKPCIFSEQEIKLGNLDGYCKRIKKIKGVWRLWSS